MFIVWEEGDGGDNNLVPLILVTKDAAARRIESRYDHYSLLATIQDLFGLPRLGAAATAQPLTPLIAAVVVELRAPPEPTRPWAVMIT